MVRSMSITSLISTPWRLLKNPIFLYQHHRLIHAVRVMLAFACGGTIDLLFGIPYGSWTLITIVVLLCNVQTQGEVSKKSGQRVFGTLIGALAGLLAVALHLVSPWLGFTWLILAILLSAYHALGRAGEAAVIAGVTAVIVGGMGDAAMEESLWRLLNVIIGSSIAFTFASLLPSRAIDRWRFLLVENLHEAALIYRLLSHNSSVEIETALDRFNVRMIKMRALILPAAKECQQNSTRFEQIQRCQRIMLIILERMYVDSPGRAVQEENRSQKAMTLSKLRRAARSLLNLRADLLEVVFRQSLPPANPADGKTAGFLTVELHQTVSRVCDELYLLLPVIIGTQHPLALLNPAGLRYLRR